jgi:triosephosphate isomerase
MRKRLVAGNWKMHGSLAANQRLLESVKAGAASAPGVEIAVCVPFPYLHQAAAVLGGAEGGNAVGWGAQTLSEHDAGAYTGEVSGAMLRELGCRYVIVGHSERRHLYGERDVQVAAKFGAAQRVGLVPILCVGETLDERDAGHVESVLHSQLGGCLAGVTRRRVIDTVIAYEPVWAIGTGRNATPEQAQEAHAFIRAELGRIFDDETARQVRIQYGGSVKPGNMFELIAQPDVDGALVGGASLEPESFHEIVRAAERSLESAPA